MDKFKIPKTWEELIVALDERSVRARESFEHAVSREAADLLDAHVATANAALDRARFYYLNDIVGFLEDTYRGCPSPYEILRSRRVHIAWAVSEVLRGAEDAEPSG